MDKILAIILNWNEIEFTKRCINSMLSQNCADFILEVLVIDNNSDHDPSKILLNQFPNIEIILLEKNIGVAGGRNIGIDYAIKHNFNFILFIDNDAYADIKMVEYLWKSSKRNITAGIFGPKIYCADTENIIWRAGSTSWKWTYLHSGFKIIKSFAILLNKNIPKFLDTERGDGSYDYGQYDKEQNVAFQIGCVQFIRLEVIEEVGLLDTKFSPYGSEDIDFCIRARKNHWAIRYIPKAICWHRIESSMKDNFKRSFNNTKNIIILARKNLSPIYFYLLFMPDFIFITTPLIIFKNIFYAKIDSLKGFLMGLKWNLRDVKKNGLFLS